MYFFVKGFEQKEEILLFLMGRRKTVTGGGKPFLLNVSQWLTVMNIHNAENSRYDVTM